MTGVHVTDVSKYMRNKMNGKYRKVKDISSSGTETLKDKEHFVNRKRSKHSVNI